MGTGHTGIPSVWNNGMEFSFDTERYSDDAVVLAALEETLVAMLSQQDALALKVRVHRVPSKEEYLYINVDRPGWGHDGHKARRVHQGPATPQTAGHLGVGQPGPQRGGWDRAAVQSPSGGG